MLHTHFFTPCQLHKEHKKNEATYFCADCGVSSTPLCGHCIGQHAGHRVIQVRAQRSQLPSNQVLFCRLVP